MNIFAGWSYLSVLSVFTLSLSACAGGTVNRVSTDTEALPDGLQDRFEIRDRAVTPSPTPTPIDSPSPVPTAIPPKKTKGKKGKAGKAKPMPVPVASASAAPTPTPALTEVVMPSRRPAKEPFTTGEHLVLEITYFGMAAGDFLLDVLPNKVIDNHPVYHIKGTAVSASVFNLFYRLNDTVETFIDYNGIFSRRFQLLLDETKQTRNSIELNDSEKGQTYYWNRWKHVEKDYVETKNFFPMDRLSQDSLSALYYLRTVPLPDGAQFSFPVINEGKNWECVCTVVRREILKTPLGRVRTVVIKPETRYQGILQKKGDSYLWLTDDEHRYPVRLEAKVKIGTVVATLKRVEPGTPSPKK